MSLPKVNWKRVQSRLDLNPDGIPGPRTWGGIYAHMGARDLAKPLGIVTWKRIGNIAENPLRLANWLGQMAHESGSFRRMTENLNYTTANGIKKTWPSRFPTPNSARPFVRNPQGLANMVYSRRLGNTRPNDGWLYRGRGIIQLTGKYNYSKYGTRLNAPFVENPDMVSEPQWAVTIAILYWQDKNLNALADKDERRSITRRINGGLNGYRDRVRRTNHALKLFKA